MTYKNIATVNIALQNASLTSVGFGTPLFASSHNYFPERVRAYGSLQDAAVDLPTSSNAYKALQSGFGNSPRPSVIKVGRRDSDTTLTIVTGATTASVSVFVKDSEDLFSVAATGTGADADAVATSLVASIEANSDIATYTTITVTGNVILITADNDYQVFFSNISSEIIDTHASTESAADMVAAIETEDNDFYFISSDDHSETFVLALADVIEAKEKIFFFSSYEAGAVSAFVDGTSTDLLAKVKTAKYFRTKGLFHQSADTDFPEMKYIGFNAGFTAGSVSWANLVLSLAATTSPVTGFNLSTTEKGNVDARNAAFIENLGSSVLRNGRTASGESIDIIRGRDNLNFDMTSEIVRLLISQTGGKVPYNDTGIAQIESVVAGVLNRYVDRGFINPNFILNFPRVSKVSASDKSNRIYTQGRWSAELTNAIEIVDPIQGILSIDL
jgi:hypothetical protein